MKRNLTAIIIIAAFCFNSCNKKNAAPSFESRILGNWLVVDADNKPHADEWGFYYVISVKFYSNNSFRLNLGTGVDDDNNTAKTGTWKLKDNKNSIVFYTVAESGGTIYRDTTEFNISFNPDKKLVLENNRVKILHQKMDN
jgi:hypothetical protein